jgi:hypothetical protein
MHERRRGALTNAVNGDVRKQAGVPVALPKQLPTLLDAKAILSLNTVNLVASVADVSGICQKQVADLLANQKVMQQEQRTTCSRINRLKTIQGEL